MNGSNLTETQDKKHLTKQEIAFESGDAFEGETHNLTHPLMSDWDDDNVIVIDLKEERSSNIFQTKNNGRQAFETSESSFSNYIQPDCLDSSLSRSETHRNKNQTDDFGKKDVESQRPFSVSSRSIKIGAFDDNFHSESQVPKGNLNGPKNVISKVSKNGKLQYGQKSKSICVDHLETLAQEQQENGNQDINFGGKNEKSCKSKLEQKLAPVKVRPWEQKNTNLASKQRNPSSLYEPIDSPSPTQFVNMNSSTGSPMSGTIMTPSSDESGRKADLQPRKLNLDSMVNGSRPETAVETQSTCKQTALEEQLQRSLDRTVKPFGIYRGVMGRWTPINEKGEYQFNGRKTRSNDFLDKLETSVSSRTRTRSSMGYTSNTSSSSNMTRIEKNLFLGNMDAATDVILLESNAVTHIVSVDSVPLPRKISSMLPRMTFLHLQISDLPDEDLLSRLVEAIDFIDNAISKGGIVLVHCFRGRSRSATVVIAYLMHKHHYKLEKAFYKVKSKREIINPHIGFLAQLKLFEAMDYTLDPGNIQYKMFRLFCASERMRKAKILFRDSLEKVLDSDPAGGLPGSAEAAAAAVSRGRYPMIFKCRKCKRTLASAFNMLPHVRGETPNWMDEIWARLSEEDVIDDASSPAGLNLCSQSVFITPVGWMEQEIKQNLSGRLYCPNCQVRVGNYSWVLGDLCKGCGATVLPAFQLDVTEIIFRTHTKYLQTGYVNRGPILV